MNRRGADVLIACVCGVFAANCGDNDLGIQKRRPNQAPETSLTSGPPDSVSATDYRVQFFWSGRDADGTIDHYDLILVDHPTIKSTISLGDSASTVVITVPTPDDPRWSGTFANDSTFITRADTLRRDPQPGDSEQPYDVFESPFERWHTLFVRAVDNEGIADPTPDYRSFNAVNFAPTVRLKTPIKPGEPFIGPPVIVFNWDGVDPLGDGFKTDPVASRWVLIPSDTKGLNEYLSWPDSLYHLPSRYEWSPWHKWGASDSSGVQAIVRGLTTDARYIFAVQALDEGGAITPVFDYRTPNFNNAALIRVSGAVGPTLTVRERFMGSHSVTVESRPVRLDIAAGQPVNFHWSADASAYGGRITGYRFGWNIQNPDDDSGWSSWSATQQEAPTRTFTAGAPRFFLQVRDNADGITSIQFELSVHRVNATRDVLWVDDGAEIVRGDGSELREDERWTDVLSSLADQHLFAFSPSVDIYDVADHAALPPPIELVFRYKNIVWTVVPGSKATALEELALFRDPELKRNHALVPRFNYLDVYIEQGGNLWISGRTPLFDMWPDDLRDPSERQKAINVTNWQDPVDRHPFRDSAGVVSLAYKMGVEMFDQGSGLGTQRGSAPGYYCLGLRRTRGVDPQLFESSEALMHTHEISMPTVDVESPNAAGNHYTTSIGSILDGDTSVSHSHDTHIGEELLRELRAGGMIRISTGTWDGGETRHLAHAHDIELRDHFGSWGAPRLETSTRWDTGAGLPGRPYIEIYNMPIGLGQALPPLAPELWRTVPIYEYVSEIAADPERQFFYPETADGQPVFLMTRRDPTDLRFSRAVSGFQPFLLTADSHLRLARFVLVRHFGLGTPTP